MKENYLNEDYVYFSLKNLKSIFKNKAANVFKILEMNYIAISQEIADIAQALQDKNMEVVKIKAHNLKTKLGYLDMLEAQQNARQIELSANVENIDQVKILLKGINENWGKAKLEIAELLKKLNTKNPLL